MRRSEPLDSLEQAYGYDIERTLVEEERRNYDVCYAIHHDDESQPREEEELWPSSS